MSLYGSSVEYGLHCLLHLVDRPESGQPSSKDLAEFQGISPSYVAKLFTQLEKAGIVRSAEGVRGGFRLARPAEQITVLDVVDALEGDKPLFQCREIRRNCILYGDDPPKSATQGLCGIHALMRDAERRMRQVLADQTLAGLAANVARKVPAGLFKSTSAWFQERQSERRGGAARRTNDKEDRT